MTLAPRTRLGSFEIVAPLGAGGMGEVYRARDTALQREVAIKILPRALAEDEERVARFEREARMLASLNHPNIATIHDIKRWNDVLYLVLELIPGATLSDRIGAGPLPVREALAIFRQIATALEAAHGRGIMHRDLKPENVKITPEGVVKVLDFGLAKEHLEGPAGTSRSDTRTAPRNMTREGDVLGTPAYMSPEQARGETVDKRTDIWAFGCCLFEALAGRHPFHGRTISDVLAAVIKTEPDFGALPQGVPGNVAQLLRRCLQKDVRKRLRDIGDARIEIEEALEASTSEARFRRQVPALAAALGALAALALGLGLGPLLRPAPPRPEKVIRFEIAPEPTESIALGYGPAVAISPDGAAAVYVVRRGESTELRARDLKDLATRRFPRSSGAQGPFFAPPGNLLGFFAQGKLVSSAPNDPSPRALADAPSPRGGSWQGDRIVFSPESDGGLFWTSARNPRPVALTELAADKQEKSHRWPALLPGGRRALFTTWSGDRFDVEIVDLESGERKLLFREGSYPRYAATGHLIFARGPALMAAPFDASDLSVGEPVTVLQDVHYDPLTGASFYDLSSEGTLIYAPLSDPRSGEVQGRILAIDRHGTGRVLFSPPRGYQVPRLSPSGHELLVTITEGESTDVWKIDLRRGALSRLTYDGNSGAAIWNPDGRGITYSSSRGGTFNLFSKLDGSPDPPGPLGSSDNARFPNSWHPGGAVLAFTELHPETEFDIWIWRKATGESEPYLNMPFNETAAVFSPDGRFLAYVSNETGRDEVYLRSFEGEGKWLVSSEGGREPVWSADGTELFYRDQEWMMVVPVETSPELDLAPPARLFEAPYDEAGSPYASYELGRGGAEFIMVRSDEEQEAERLIVVVNWFDELRRLVPVER